MISRFLILGSVLFLNVTANAEGPMPGGPAPAPAMAINPSFKANNPLGDSGLAASGTSTSSSNSGTFAPSQGINSNNVANVYGASMLSSISPNQINQDPSGSFAGGGMRGGGGSGGHQTVSGQALASDFFSSLNSASSSNQREEETTTGVVETNGVVHVAGFPRRAADPNAAPR